MTRPAGHHVGMSDNPTVPPGGRLRERTAEEIRVILARRRMSAAELARRTGIKQSTMARRMVGETAFDLDDLEVIANALGVKVSDLIRDADKGPQDIAPYPALTARGTGDATRPKGGRPKNRPDASAPSPHLRRPARIRSA